jgi:hypothetical protein
MNAVETGGVVVINVFFFLFTTAQGMNGLYWIIFNGGRTTINHPPVITI